MATGSKLGITLASVTLAGLLLTACSPEDALRGVGENRGEVPISKMIFRKLQTKNMSLKSPIMVRIFKEENVLEVWKRKRGSNQFAMLHSFEICKWSGELGPKFKEGDRQAPEGFYYVNPHQLNPRSSYHLSFNMGFPNSYDRSHGRTGTHLMIHGDCSSAGCYSMTDAQVEDIYALAREALRGGQTAFQIQAFPFHMTAENMARHRNHKHFEFWKQIKEGYDHFELTKRPPKVDVCGRSYNFNKDFGETALNAAASCPAHSMNPNLLAAYESRKISDNAAFTQLAARLDAQDKAKAEAEKLAAEKATLLAALEAEKAAEKERLRLEKQAALEAALIAEATAKKQPVTIVAGAKPLTPNGIPLPQTNPNSPQTQTEQQDGLGAKTRGLLGRVRGLFGGS